MEIAGKICLDRVIGLKIVGLLGPLCPEGWWHRLKIWEDWMEQKQWTCLPALDPFSRFKDVSDVSSFEEAHAHSRPLISWSAHGRLQGEDYIHLLSLAYTLIAERRDSDSVFVDWPLGTLDEGHFTPDRVVPTSVVKKFPWVYPSLSVHRSDFPIISLLNPTTKYYNFLFEKGIGSHHKWPIKSYSISGWWFQTFFMFHKFHNTLDNSSHWLTHIFQDG